MFAPTLPPSNLAIEKVAALAAVLAASFETARSRENGRRRIDRLEAILSIASQWNQTNEMEPLLVQMAEAATKLLEPIGPASFSGIGRTTRWSAARRWELKAASCGFPTTRAWWARSSHSGEPRRIGAADQGPRSIARSIANWATRPARCCACRCAAARASCSARSKSSTSWPAISQPTTSRPWSSWRPTPAIALENTQQFEQLLSRHRHIVEQAAEGVRLIGESPAIEALRSTIRRVADTELAILILGENGTGKEVVSQSIHYLSRRRDEPFIAVNCAAITETLLESELFGHEKGAFTDAHESRQGKFELASGGTLFLDEIGDLSLSGQAKLLRVLEEKVVVRVGGSKPIHTDARVIAATNQNLAEMVRQKRFRQDLYFRLNVVTLGSAAAARAGRRRDAAGRAFSGRLLPQGPSQAAEVLGRGPQPAGGPLLARQRSRAAQPDGAAGLPVDRATGSRPRTWRSSSRRAASRRRWWPSICRWPRRPTSFRSSTSRSTSNGPAAT